MQQTQCYLQRFSPIFFSKKHATLNLFWPNLAHLRLMGTPHFLFGYPILTQNCTAWWFRASLARSPSHLGVFNITLMVGLTYELPPKLDCNHRFPVDVGGTPLWFSQQNSRVRLVWRAKSWHAVGLGTNGGDDCSNVQTTWGCFYTPLEHTRKNVYQQAVKLRDSAFIVGERGCSGGVFWGCAVIFLEFVTSASKDYG